MQPRPWQRWWSRIAHWPRRRVQDTALADEIAAHLALEAEALEAEGLSPADARAAAHRAFGNATLALEDSRAEWRWRWADELGHDLRLAWRSMAHSRGFAAAAILTLALGIAATATMFSLVDALLLRPVPVAQPQRVVILSEYYAHNGGYYFGGDSALDALAFRRVQAFSALTAAAYPTAADLDGSGGPQPVSVQAVQPNFFSVLGVRAALGRIFTPAAGADAGGPPRHHVAVLSHGLWRRRFDASSAILGRQIILNQQPYTVIGVMPRRFLVPRANAQIWVPRAFGPASLTASARGDRAWTIFACLRPQVTLRQAQAQLTAVMAGLAQRHRADHEWRVMLHPLETFTNQEQHNGPVLVMLMAAAGWLLLLACANIAGLLLARAAARRHELALRAALGAGRLRLLRQLLAECALLAAGGGALGLATSAWTARLFAAQLHAIGAKMQPPQLDWRVALFTLAVAAFTVVLFGLAPAWQASRADPQAALQADARGAVGGRARLRRGLVAGQVALAIVLLAAAGLTIGVVVLELAPAGFGFNPRRLTVALLTLPRQSTAARGGIGPRNPAAWAADANAIAARLRHLPGVTAAATARSLPLTGAGATGVRLRPGGASSGAAFYPVSPGYFATLQIPLLRGRDFTSADTAATPAVAIVDRRFLRQYFHGRDPVGRIVLVGYFDYLNNRGQLVNAGVHPRAVAIVGVVGSVQRFLGYAQAEPAMYFPLAQWPTRHPIAILRSAGAPPGPKAIGRAVWSAAGSKTIVGDMSSMHHLLGENAGAVRLLAGLLVIFAILALVLAAVGIYGVMAYLARRRTAEIGVRLALGAPRRSISAMMLREAAMFTGLGWLAGLGLAALLPRALSAVFGAGYMPTYAEAVWPAAVLIPLAALLAAYLPARRAAGLDPAQCLRRE